jgi:hypothetical protein
METTLAANKTVAGLIILLSRSARLCRGRRTTNRALFGKTKVCTPTLGNPEIAKVVRKVNLKG